MTQKVNFPKTSTTVSGALVNVANQPQKILVVSQMTAAGTAVDGALNENLQANADTLAGPTSFGAEVVRAARLVNPDSQIDAIFLDDDGSGVPADGVINFTGSTATESGELTVIIGSARHHALSIAITSGDNATAIGAALVAAIVADSTIMVTSVNTTGSVAITCTNDGTAGNDIPIEVRGTVAGVVIALTAMTSGATDPSLTSVFDVVGEIRYQTILWTWADDVSVLGTFVDDRLNVTNDVLDGLGWTGKTDTLINHVSAIGALNNLICYHAEKLETGATLKGSSSVEWPVAISAYAGALRARKLTVGSAIASLNVGASGSDSTGGPALASRPLANTPIFHMTPFRNGRGWTKTDVAAINVVGGSVIGNNDSNNQIALGEMFTTRTTEAGSPDDTFKFVNYFDTATGIREYIDANLRSRFSQMRLSDGDLVAGRPVTNQRQIEATLTEFWSTLASPDFVLARGGEVNREFFLANLVVSINFQTGSVTWSAKVPIVTQVRNISGDIQIIFALSEGVIGEEAEEDVEVAA